MELVFNIAIQIAAITMLFAMSATAALISAAAIYFVWCIITR